MLRNQIYFSIKPFVPKPVRMAVRRHLARRKRGRVGAVWPILPGSERPPAAWSGWPDGKKFAFVLTHDVEGPVGLRNTRPLFALEHELGFRSSFNFIPEGSYSIPAELRAELTQHGFEVGVHDLEHDGRLYQSRARFAENASRINHYLRDWNVTGFRSGFMLHNLQWLHDLNIRYDASTFDTDPFEPQPEGCHTIFPFWVPYPGGVNGTANGQPAKTGYVELPYTLPQDSTLFLLLGEETADVWIKKLDWIAAQGGMALVNIHPDYIDFAEGSETGARRPPRNTYPVARVRELLEYVTTKYAGQCWNPSAEELAAWYVSANPPPPASASLNGHAPALLRGKRAAVLLYSHYPADPRPRRAAESLIAAGMEVDLICLREKDSEATRETIGGVNVLRVPLRRQRGSKLAYLSLYGKFLLYCFALLTWRNLLRRKYDLVHVHNMPDVLVFAALLPKLRGARLLLDLHDPMPELMMSIYELPADHLVVRLLRRLERWSIGFANLALTPNAAFRSLFISRSCRPEKMQIVMNSPEEGVFAAGHSPPCAETNGAREPGAEFRLMHHGSIVHRHGIDLLVEAIAQVRPKLPGVRLDIYGAATPFLEVVLAAGRRLGVEDCIRVHGAKTQPEIAQAICDCDLGVVPNRRSAFTEINFPTRIFEYLAMRRPVLAPATRGIRDYFQPDQLLMFEPDQVADLAARILWASENPAALREFVSRGSAVYGANLWHAEQRRLLEYVAALLPPQPAAA